MKKQAGLALALAVLAGGCGGKGEAEHGQHGGAHEAQAASAHAAMPSNVNLPSQAEIAALFDLWNQTLQTGGPHDMAMLYAEDGVLLPTVSNQPRNNRPEIADYFVHFLELHPRGTINESYIDVLDATTAVHSGIYTFDVTRDGQPAYVVARFSYIYEKYGQKWLIKSHHSSAMPEPVSQRPPALADRLNGRVRMASYEADPHGYDAAHDRESSKGRAHAAPAGGGGGGGGGH